MNKQQKDKKAIIITIAVLGVVSMTPAMTWAMGQGNGGRVGGGMIGQNMIDPDGDGVPIGLEDDDGDGILNKDDDDFVKPMQNARDNDDDGVPNRIDDDFEKPEDGTGQRAGQINTNRPEGAGSGQMMQQRNSPVQQRMNGAVPIEAQKEQIQQQAKKQVQNRVQNNQNSMGEQMRTMNQQQQQLEQQIAQDITQIKQEKGVKKFLFGVDKEVTQRAQNRLLEQQQKIQQMNEVVGEIEDPQLQITAQQQITRMEEISKLLQQEIEQNKSGVLSWIQNIFN